MDEDMLHMQQEAARRVRRMQEHSRRVFEEREGRTSASLAAARPPLYTRQEPPMPPCEPTPPPCEPPPKSVPAESRRPDMEQLMLLAMALLLFRSGCRPELAVALLYLAM